LGFLSALLFYKLSLKKFIRKGAGMKRFFVVPALLVLFLLSAHTGFAQSSNEISTMKEDTKALKEGQQAIQKELQEIKNQLKAKPAPAEFKETVVNVDGDSFKGKQDAKLALIEFSDYQ
jgi:CRISPR/Cas system-associated endonuclease Cas3-HD